jgi:hypothetical protein
MYLAIASQCPSEEEIERYSLEDIIEESEVAAIEEHLLICHACQNRLTAADLAYTATLRAALTRFDLIPVHIHAVHQTSEGSVYLWTSDAGEGCCIARIQGCEVDCGHVVESVLDAIRQNNTRFRALLPEHICSSKCRGNEL